MKGFRIFKYKNIEIITTEDYSVISNFHDNIRILETSRTFSGIRVKQKSSLSFDSHVRIPRS